MAQDDFLSFLQSPKSLSAAHRALRLHLAFPDGVTNDMLLPQRVYGTESICGGIEYVVLCLSTDASLPLKEFIAVPARIEFVTDRGDLRSVCGIVSRASAGNSDGGVATYELVVHDALALLDKRVNTRVFQSVTELEVIQALHDEWLRINPVLVGSFELEIDPLLQRHRFPKREMIRQYNESDARFVQRLLKRRGISWFIRPGHARSQGKQDARDERPAHTLVLFDDWHSLDQNAAGSVRFHRDSATEKRDTITAWSGVRTLQPGSVARHSWDYRNPRGRQFMTVSAKSEADQGSTGNQFAASLDDYVLEAPHVGNDYQDFYALGQIRLARHDYETKCFRGEGSVRDFCVGEYFELTDHPEIDKHPKEEREFVITELRVDAVNNLPSDLAERAGRLFERNRWETSGDGARALEAAAGGNAVRSRNEFTAVRRGVRLVPQYDPRADLPQTQMESAIVVGPQQEEVYCDRLGRVKVRFPATRGADHSRAAGAGASDTEADSAWVRVASNWAGNGAGSQNQCGALGLPRVGTEVLIAYLGGDPDKPIVISQLYNEVAVPPGISQMGELPGNRYLSGLRSREIGGSRANRLQLDDSHGQISAQLASDHGSSQLNLGWLTQPRANGGGRPRGEGAELRSEKAVAVRGAKGVLISAAGGADTQLDREELLGIADTIQGVADQLSQLAVTHNASDADGAQLSELIAKLRHLHEGANLQDGKVGSGLGGRPIVAVSAPAGAVIASQQNVVLGAESTIDALSVGDTRVAAGGSLLMRAARGMSLFAYKFGMRLVAATGNIRIETQNGDVEITSLGRIKLIASKGIELQSPEIKMVAQGAQVNYGGGAITEQSTGTHTIKSANFKHMKGGSGSPEELKLPSTEVEHDQQVMMVDQVTGEPLPNQRYRITLEDGTVFEGKSDSGGKTERFPSTLAFAAFHVELLD